MASVATVDSLPEPGPVLGDETAGCASRRGRTRKRKSGDSVNNESTNGKKRTFDDFFNFCSFVLAYEEQLERQASTAVNSPLPHPTTNITNNHTTDHSSTNSSNSNHSSTLTLNDTADSAAHSDHHGNGDCTHAARNGTSHNHHTTTTTAISSSSSSSVSGESGDEGERGGLMDSPKGSSSNDKLEYTSEDESWNLVTCFCRRPFAGRPMIECSKCNTWVHLFCAKIRKSAVPEVYTCPSCSPSGKNTYTRRSSLSNSSTNSAN